MKDVKKNFVSWEKYIADNGIDARRGIATCVMKSEHILPGCVDKFEDAPQSEEAKNRKFVESREETSKAIAGTVEYCYETGGYVGVLSHHAFIKHVELSAKVQSFLEQEKNKDLRALLGFNMPAAYVDFLTQIAVDMSKSGASLTCDLPKYEMHISDSYKKAGTLKKIIETKNADGKDVKVSVWYPDVDDHEYWGPRMSKGLNEAEGNMKLLHEVLSVLPERIYFRFVSTDPVTGIPVEEVLQDEQGEVENKVSKKSELSFKISIPYRKVREMTLKDGVVYGVKKDPDCFLSENDLQEIAFKYCDIKVDKGNGHMRRSTIDEASNRGLEILVKLTREGSYLPETVSDEEIVTYWASKAYTKLCRIAQTKQIPTRAQMIWVKQIVRLYGPWWKAMCGTDVYDPIKFHEEFKAAQDELLRIHLEKSKNRLEVKNPELARLVNEKIDAIEII